MAKKAKNRNYYKSGKFNGDQWSAKVTNDETKDRATLTFAKDFIGRATDLKTMKVKINKEFNNVTKQINRIKKDKDTGELVKQSLTSQLKAYEAARTEFLNAIKALHTGCINEFNDRMQAFFDATNEAETTTTGTSNTKVDGGNISEGDNDNIE